MESRENSKQKKSQREEQVLSLMERIHSGRGHLGE